jgi:hypothetical protein
MTRTQKIDELELRIQRLENFIFPGLDDLSIDTESNPSKER